MTSSNEKSVPLGFLFQLSDDVPGDNKTNNNINNDSSTNNQIPAEEFTAHGIFKGAIDHMNDRDTVQEQVIDIGSQKTKINKLSISGISRIRNGFVHDLVRKSLDARTVNDVVIELREAAGKLKVLGLSKGVLIELDQSNDEDNAVDVRFICKDASRYIIKTGVNVGDDEGTANVTGRINNIWGGGESFEANYIRGSKTQAAFQGILGVPLNADPHTRVELSAGQTNINNRPYCSHDELRRSLGLLYRTHGPLGQHELHYSASWRDICKLGFDASPSLRADAGHTLKSSIAYTFTCDTRDFPTVPTSGSLFKATKEFAGIGGDVQFIKSNFELQTNQNLGSGYILSMGIQGGLLWNLKQISGQTYSTSPLADRFFVGGITSVRGFDHRGIGPRDGNDSLGGDIFYSAGASLLTPLPFVRSPAIKGHIWANAGQNALLDGRGLLQKEATSSTVTTKEISRFLSCPSAAIGVGLVYRHSLVRVELSYCLPMMATETDKLHPGLQFGLGFQFL